MGPRYKNINPLAGYPASPGWMWEGEGGGGGERCAKDEVPSIGAYKTG